MAAEVSERHSDALLADRDRLAAIAQNAGVTNVSIDNSVTNHNVVNNALLDQSIHNQVAIMMRSHGEQMGQYMAQQNLNQQQMINLLFLHLKRSQPEPVIQILGSGGGPPPPPAAGAVVARRRRNKREGPYEAPAPATSDTKPPPPAPPAPQAVAALPAPTPPLAIESTVAPLPPPRPGAAVVPERTSKRSRCPSGAGGHQGARTDPTGAGRSSLR